MRTVPPELRSLGSLLWASFKSLVVAVVGILSAIISLAAWFVRPSSTVPLAWFVGALVLGSLVLATLLESTLRALVHAAQPLPKVKRAIAEKPLEGDERIILLLEPSPLFSHDMVVSLYLVEQEQYERLTGHGIVQNIQDNGLIQVRLGALEIPDIKTRLKANDSTLLSHLRVKPSVARSSVTAVIGDRI